MKVSPTRIAFVLLVAVATFTGAVRVAGASPKEARVAVVVGSNIGIHNDRPLQFAEQDADRFARLLLDLGGVERDRVYLVKGGGATAVRQAVNEAKGRILELAKLGPTALIVYVSSHADDSSLHLDGTLLPIEELRKSVQGTPASLRLVIIDACRTPANAASKGGSPGPEVAVRLEGSEKLQGDLFISSSSIGEPAQEWSFLRGALFTHHMITGLRGAADVDRNGRVSLSESYSYAFRQTLANAVSAGPGAQHPSFDFQMKGFGDWTFTTPSEERSAVILDEKISGDVWVTDSQNNIAAEVTKAPGTTLRLALPAGWYRVILPQDQRTARAVDFTLTWGAERRIRESDLVAVSLRDVSTRGQKPVTSYPVLLSLHYAFSAGDVDGVSQLHTVALALDFTVRRFTLGAFFGFAPTAFENDRVEVQQLEFPMLGRVGREFQIRMFNLQVGLEGGASLARQELSQKNQQALEDVSVSPQDSRKTWIPEAGGFMSFQIPIVERLAAVVQGDVGVKWVQVQSDWSPHFSGRIGLGMGVRF